MVSFRGAISRRWIPLCAGVLAACVLAPAATAASPVVIETDLGTLGGPTSDAAAINDAGQVVGSSQTAGGETHAFSWTAAGGMVDLGTLGGANSDAEAVNDHGEVVGSSQIADGTSHAFSWTAAGGMVDLGTLGSDYSAAVAVNDGGQVVGNSSTRGDTSTDAFSWTATGGMVDLGTLGGNGSTAHDVNDSGQVVGAGLTGEPLTRHAFSWTSAGAMVDLGTLGGSNSEAVDVNDAGQVVGSAQTEHFPTSRAFSWTAAGGMIDLGTLDNSGSPSPGSAANAVNANGLVVGLSQLQGPNFTAVTHAFTWSAGAGLSDLGTLGGDNSSAKAVNDHGQVAGTSQAPDGVYHAFSWTAAGGMVDLGELGLDTAVVINNSGQIAGTTVGGAARAVLWTLAVPFASMTAKALVVVPPGAGNDSFVLDTTLVPGSGGNGIDPAREPVTLTLAGTRIALPAGALRHTPHLDIFVGKVNGGMLTLTIQPAGNGFRLFAHGSGFDLPAPHLPLTVELTIGDDAGVTDATARVVPPG